MQLALSTIICQTSSAKHLPKVLRCNHPAPIRLPLSGDTPPHHFRGGHVKYRFWLAVSALMLLLACSSNDPATAPTITLNATPEAIAPGQNSQLRWQVSGSEPITISLSPEVEETLISPLTVSPSATTTYTLTASNSAGSNSASVTITVTDEPTISTFRATPTEGTAPLAVTFDWTLNVAASCTFNPGDGNTQTLTDCLTDQQTTYTYDQAGTYDARLTLENGNTQTTTVMVLPADNSVTVGGFVAEQSRNVVIILTDEDQQAVTLDSLNRAIATVTTSLGADADSLGADTTPSVRGANAALLALLGQQDSPADRQDSLQVTETEQLFSLAGDVVVAVDSRGQVVGSSQLTPATNSATNGDTNSVRFDLDIPADTTVALLLAAADGQGGWLCKGSLEYQVIEDQATTSSQQTLYRFPASLINTSSLQAGRFVFNELTGQPAALLEGDTSSMVGDVPDDAVLDALISPEDAPAFADGVYRLCANDNAVQTNVLADVNWQSDAFTDGAIAEGESTVYDYALALLIGEENGQRRLLGSAPINPDGTLRVPLTYAGSINAQLVMTDVAFFEADKQQFPLTPAYAFAEDVQTAEDTETDIDLRQQGGGLAYISGNVVTGSGGAVAGATVIMVVDGERLAFNVATADENGFFELLIPTSDEAYILYAQNPAATLGGVASNDTTGVRYVIDDGTSIDQDITLNVPINSEIDPSTRPEVSAGSDVVVSVGDTVRLQGNASDPDGDALSLRWEVLSQPAGSDLTLSDTDNDADNNDADNDTVTFTPEQVGDYVLRLTASDGRTLAADLVTVRVLPDGSSAVDSVQFTNAPVFAELVEGGDGYTLELSRSGAANEPLTVRLRLGENNTSEPDQIRLEGTTRDGSGYLVTFDTAQVRTTITVFALEDDTPENSELLVLELAEADAYTLGNNTQAGFVISDAPNPIDPPPPAPSSRCEGSFAVRQAADLTDLTRCQDITGDLIIDPLVPDPLALSLQQTGDITSLEPLANLQTILGNLTIRNTLLESLTGLDNLQQIGGNLTLDNNSVLTDISAIATRTDNDITGNVTINSNSSLDCPAQNLTLTVDETTDNLVDCNQSPDPVVPDPVINAPVITTFTATPEVIEAGQDSRLEWIVTGTAPVTLTLEGTDEQDVSDDSSVAVTPTITTTYTLTASNSAGEDSASITVTVDLPATTCDNSYTITNQADVNALEACTIITGNLILEDIEDTPLDLTPLANLTRINRDLIINNNDSLASLAGLENLTEIGGNLLIEDNDSLASLAGLENLETVGGSVDIDDNDLVISLEPLANLTTIGGFLDIDNTALTDLTGLGALASIGGELFINQNDQLTSLAGLNSLTSIGSYLEITGNPLLANVNGLETLERIGAGIYIGFDKGANSIDGNALLSDLSALADLTDADIGGNERFIKGNAALDCPAQNLSFTVTASEDNLVDCAVATDVCPGNVTVTSQTELDEVASCREITGNLTITGSEDIITLEALTNLATIGGNLEILENPNLTSTAGLENLTSLGGNVRLNINDALTSLEGFTGLDTVNELYIGLNNNLTNLTGLENLSSVSRIDMIGNGVLEDITALENIISPVTRLIIQENDNLTDLTGLGGITTVTDDVLILGNPALTTLTGLAVTDIGNILELRDNPALTDLTGLESLTSIGNYLQIANNDALTNLAALTNLESVGGSILVQENAILPSLNGLQNIMGYDDDNNVQVTDNPLLDCRQPEPTSTLSFEVDVSAGNLVNCGEVVLTTCDGNRTVSAQSQLDALALCREITGSLTIENSTDIIDLTALANLTTVGTADSDNFVIRNNSGLTSLIGLANLTSLTGNLHIENNDSLGNLSGLDSLSSLNQLIVDDNDTLRNLTGFTSPSGVTMTNAPTISNNANLIELIGLGSTTVNGGTLSIINNDALDELNGMQIITTVDTILIEDNDSLRSLAGLDNLSSISGTLRIRNNALFNIDALDGLNSIGDQLIIADNPLLTDLTGLTDLTEVGNGAASTSESQLTISNNNALETLAALSRLTTVAGDINIIDNDDVVFVNLSGLQNITDYDNSNTVTIQNNQFLDCTPPPTLLFLVDSSTGNAVNCAVPAPCTGDYTITNQAQLDALEQCTEVTGNLTIENSTDIVDLSALANLTSVGVGTPCCVDSLIIRNNSALQSLAGLDNLTTIENRLELDNNLVLNDISALSALNTFTSGGGGIVRIDNNPTLPDLAGLTGIVSPAAVFVTNNNSLTSLAGLDNVTDVFSNLWITGNANLTSLAALSNLTSIDGQFLINDNDSLTTLTGLEALTEMTGTFTVEQLSIQGNAALENLSALSNLTTLNGDITVSNNTDPAFTNLDGLQNITGFDNATYQITINDNTNLDCTQPTPTPTLSFIVDNSTGNAVDCP